ncbi:extensin family protein [Mesorhizobium sp. ORM8.1]
MEQPLTPRADQPLKPRGKHRLKARVKRHITPKKTQDTQAPPPSPGVPVPEARPAEAKKPGAKIEDQKTEAPKTNGAPGRLNEEKLLEKKRAEPEPSTPEPSTDTESEPEPPAVVPIPTERPPEKRQSEPEPSAAEPSTDTESEPEPPAVVPIPTERPDIAKPQVEPPAVAPQPPEKPAGAGDEMLPDPRSADRPGEKMPADEVACRARLKALGVEFEEHKAESNPEIGCSIPYPIVLKSLGKTIAVGPGTSIGIAPGTELNCKMAEAAARFAADVIQPAAKAEFGADLKSIGQASAFVCRPRNGTRKLSEHAFGNALDIASFTLSDGRKIEISPAPPEEDAKFLNTVRKAACGPFKTVLGPGADADHAFHFHLDLEPRRHGGTFCQ